MACPNPDCRHRNKRKLRPLVISLIPTPATQDGGTINNNPSTPDDDGTSPPPPRSTTATSTTTTASTTARHEQITRMFTTHPSLSTHFHPPVFSPGVPSREIRNRIKLLEYANKACLIPDGEWKAIDRALKEQQRSCEEDVEDITTKLDNQLNVVSDVGTQHVSIDPFRYLASTTKVDGLPESEESNNADNVNDSQQQHQLIKKKKRWPQTITTSLIPIPSTRRGSAEDIALPYSCELWRKAKTLNRDRSVLACTLAHLVAMKTLVDSKVDDDVGFDFILEDNVRAFVGFEEDYVSMTDGHANSNEWTGWSCECANRMWDLIDASDSYATDNAESAQQSQCTSDALQRCHLRYYGWLGSLPNLTWVYQNHIPRKGTAAGDNKIFPFPCNDDFEFDNIPTGKTSANKQQQKKKLASDTQQLEDATDSSTPRFTAPGGTAVFGTFAYSVSLDAYRTLIQMLQNDVGALVWKSKKMRAYHAKPIDKILPRHVRETFGERSVHLTDKVAFVRCPMLGSLLHQQWEQGFCESTELQLGLLMGVSNVANDGTVWNNVWLTEEDRKVVEHRQRRGKWTERTKL
eukprot:scaffold2604_cov198-Alexandrium_tamarense.AAC.29